MNGAPKVGLQRYLTTGHRVPARSKNLTSNNPVRIQIADVSSFLARSEFIGHFNAVGIVGSGKNIEIKVLGLTNRNRLKCKTISVNDRILSCHRRARQVIFNFPVQKDHIYVITIA